MSILEIIRKRTSVRTYDKRLISKDIEQEIRDYIKSVEGPFDAGVRLELINTAGDTDDGPKRLGTYGFISGATAFIAAAMDKKDKKELQLGYVMEKVILYITSIGLGTCWLGGTFKRSDFSRAIDLGENEILPIVTPIGYPSSNKSLIEKAMSLSGNSNKRKPWEELFYLKYFGAPLYYNSAGQYSIPLEMVRLAPSASNKQPWRIIMTDEGFDFYLKHAKGYDKFSGFDIQKIDMGIAMCHFELSCNELGLRGSINIGDSNLFNLPKDIEYIVSWKIKK